ncbi:hypothetical protein FA13DRAFT_1714558 [Coprinellus micaceus]|uniref:Uncharacterized protein n=1 Tax=Coprinellus micaceus TaxID=71717 RepID=A0A4Y7SRX4_COPMI|nr:hypothetical protein FA13DRAFT_1714558 [Coprinellus micaceus]
MPTETSNRVTGRPQSPHYHWSRSARQDRLQHPLNGIKQRGPKRLFHVGLGSVEWEVASVQPLGVGSPGECQAGGGGGPGNVMCEGTRSAASWKQLRFLRTAKLGEPAIYQVRLDEQDK